MIELTNVTKLYGTVIGVNDLSLSLGPGAHGLLGSNGAGKTTFLNLITGQLKPTIGQVRVFGLSPRNNRSMLARIGYCPGDEALYSNVTGFEWVRYLLELHGYIRGEAIDRTKSAMDRVGMTGAMHREIGGYSRGMRQRTKLAQAIAHDPELLVLDEPFTGLDPIGRHQVAEMLRDWMRRGGSLILASHILHEVELISRSFLLISGGRLLATGAAEEVESLMEDVTSDIYIETDQPHQLAGQLVADDGVMAVEFNGSGLKITTNSPLSLYDRFPDLVRQGFKIREVHTSSESLQTLFDSLMHLHRGNVKP